MPVTNNNEEYKKCNSDWNFLFFYLGIPFLVGIIVIVITLILLSIGFLFNHSPAYLIFTNVAVLALSIYLSYYFINKQVNKIKYDCYNYGINNLPQATIVPVNGDLTSINK